MAADIQSVGSLTETSLSSVLLWVSDNAFSGVLALAHEEIKKSIIFERGRPIGARSNIKTESLGQIFLKDGRLTEAQLAKSLEVARSSEGTLQGQALVSMGLIDYASLGEMLKRQLLLRIYEAFAWEEGRYALISKVPDDVEKVSLEETLPQICLRGLVEKHQGTLDPEQVKPEMKPVPVGGHGFDVQALRLVGREMGFFRAINGVNAVEDILAKSRMEKEVVFAMLLAFEDLGLIRLDPQARPREKLPPESATQATSAPKSPPVSASGSASPPPPKSASPPVRPPASDSKPISSPKPKAAASASASKTSSTKASGAAILEEVHSRVANAPEQNFFEMLDLSSQATDAEVKKAYFDLARKFHPDRLPAEITGDQRKEVESFFARLSEAHSLLINKESRKEYEASLALKEEGIDQDAANKIIESEVEYQKGEALIRKGDFQGAISSLERAVQLYDQEPEYLLLLGWAHFRSASRSKNPQQINRGREVVEKGLKMKDDIPQGYFYLAMMAKSEGDVDRAARYFNKTLELNPRHAEANSELRLINRRKEKKQSGLKGFFGEEELSSGELQ